MRGHASDCAERDRFLLPFLLFPAVAFLLQCSAGSREFPTLSRIDVREFELEFLQAADDGRGHDQTREPFVVGGDDVPRSVGRGGVADHVVVRVLIFRPVLAFVRVGE